VTCSPDLTKDENGETEQRAYRKGGKREVAQRRGRGEGDVGDGSPMHRLTASYLARVGKVASVSDEGTDRGSRAGRVMRDARRRSEHVRQREAAHEGGDADLGGGEGLGFAGRADGREDEVDAGGDLIHVGFEEAARGDGGRAEADARRLWNGDRVVVRDGVLVAGDVGAIERLLGASCR